MGPAEAGLEAHVLHRQLHLWAGCCICAQPERPAMAPLPTARVAKIHPLSGLRRPRRGAS